MVRKRSHKQESDESESDSDYTPDLEAAQPKKYSLRKRTRQTFIEDFEYDANDSDLSPMRQPSDDDDFEVDEENEIGGPYTTYLQSAGTGTAGATTQNDNGLIDFEDMIRADIVINKNAVDYDHLIDKSQIVANKIIEETKATKRRGRPRKQKPLIEDFGHSILGPLVDVNFLGCEENTDNLLEPLTQVESFLEPVQENADEGEHAMSPETNEQTENSTGIVEGENGVETKSTVVEEVFEENNAPDCVSISNTENNTEELKLVNDVCVGEEGNETHKQHMEVIDISETDSVKDSNDDVIIINDKPEIIVLDD